MIGYAFPLAFDSIPRGWFESKLWIILGMSKNNDEGAFGFS
jgi:hypothetical protein